MLAEVKLGAFTCSCPLRKLTYRITFHITQCKNILLLSYFLCYLIWSYLVLCGKIELFKSAYAYTCICMRMHSCICKKTVFYAHYFDPTVGEPSNFSVGTKSNNTMSLSDSLSRIEMTLILPLTALSLRVCKSKNMQQQQMKFIYNDPPNQPARDICQLRWNVTLTSEAAFANNSGSAFGGPVA